MFKSLLGLAPELNASRWFNSRGYSMKGLKGHVVLVDFWTYSCVNCVRSVPHIQKMHEKYGDKGLVVIGVHTPEFDFEKDEKNVAEAIKRMGITYAVAHDPERTIWNAFANSYWPRQYLINGEGKIVWDHIGEGGEDELENEIVKQLKELGVKVLNPKPEQAKTRRVFLGITPETYVGRRRGKLGNFPFCTFETCEGYKDPGKHERDIIYLDGEWAHEAEYAEHASNKTGHILLKFFASEVNLVMAPGGSEPVEVEVVIDGKPLKQNKGADVKIRRGRAIVRVDRDDMYRLFKAKEPQQHEIKLVTSQKGLRAYAFTFG